MHFCRRPIVLCALLVAAATCLPSPATPSSASLSPETQSFGDVVTLASFDINGAAVASVSKAFPGSTGPAVLITTFHGFGKDPLYYVPDISAVMNSSKDADPKVITDSLVWLNFAELVTVPLEQPSSTPLVLAAGGFLPPGKSNGAISLINVTDPDNGVVHSVSEMKKGWFYHDALWYDVNKDGRLDIITARATAPVNPFKSKQGELVWFEQPASDILSDTWDEHIMFSGGPDVSICLSDLDGDGLPEIIAAEFFAASQLAVYTCPQKTWAECNQTNIEVAVVDNELGPFFYVSVEDLNGDGRKDLLATNNRYDGKGALFAYEQPAGDDDKWTRHVLGSGYTPKLPLPTQGSPGQAVAFQPRVGLTSGKPMLLMGGDDAGFVSIFTAASQDADDWSYHEHRIINSTGTVGFMAVDDLNGDGVTDIVVPLYKENRVEIISFDL